MEEQKNTKEIQKQGRFAAYKGYVEQSKKQQEPPKPKTPAKTHTMDR